MIRRSSFKVRRYAAELDRVRPLVRERSGGLCEVGFPGCEWAAVHVHHRLMRSQGGDNSLGNLLHCCMSCHRYGHLNPSAAYERGFLLRSTS